MEQKNSVEYIRKKIRQNFQAHRNNQRFQENDSFRLGLGEIKSLVEEIENLTEKDVHGLCVRIKRKKHADSNDLFRLSQAFLQSIENITMFAKTPGALQIIVKELTGHDSEQQIRAAETLCNLSLGDETVCEKIATQAGSYLITFLESVDFRLKQSSLWTLINIVSTGKKGAEILMSMEIISKCSDILYSENMSENVDLLNDIALCLNLTLKSEIFNPTTVDLGRVFENITKIPLEDERNEFVMEVIFNSHIIKSSYTFNIEQLKYIAQVTVKNILSSSHFSKMLYHVRVLANVTFIYKDTFVLILEDVCLNVNTSFANLLNHLFSFDDESFTKEVLWLLKNIIYVTNNDTKTNNLISDLKIPMRISNTFINS
ncbi:uncharacterized protein LOC129615279 [Condylostylus longicornis]|uniref:uncharacterized protein LOC129615279 n=1 Tax=Condylostylus longicornis TaxID=2530218 RepID=UPI00244E1A39|nr:uncharacterized protein LOC129615279 [Condylostylus longicornis]